MAARDSKNKIPLREEQEEMTVMILRFKGSGESLQKGFDTVKQALATLAPPAPAPRQLAARVVNPAPDGDGEGTTASLEHSDEELVDESNGDAAAAPATQRASSSPRKLTMPKFDASLDLNGDGTAWKDYAAKKNPQTINQKYLVASAWLTRHSGKEVFRIPHVFTCFRSVKWDEQRDFSQPMRKMKEKDSYFDKGEKQGDWKLTKHGLEVAEAIGNETE